MENVPQVHSEKDKKHFIAWQKQLERLGYKSYWEDLNGCDYQIPQNRIRTFMVSIKGNYVYDFPYKIPLKYRLKDLLETEVDEKYYLSNKMVKYITATNDKWTGNNNGAIVNRDIGCTINTAPTQRRCDASNYLADDLPPNADLREYIKIKNATNKGYLEAKDGDGIDISSRMHYHRGTVQKGKSQTLTCQGGESIGVITKKNE